MLGDPRFEIFAEDVAHEVFLGAMVERLCNEMKVHPRIATITGRGGHGRVVEELRIFQRALKANSMTGAIGVIAIDANCKGWNQAKTEITSLVESGLFLATAIACPDPHIERWFLADPESLQSAFDVTVNVGRDKCERDKYKDMLASSFTEAGHLLTLGGVEFAEEIVATMDLYRAGKNVPSLRHFVDELEAAIKLLSATPT